MGGKTVRTAVLAGPASEVPENLSRVLLMNCRKCFGGCTKGSWVHNNLGSCHLVHKCPVTEVVQSRVFKDFGVFWWGVFLGGGVVVISSGNIYTWCKYLHLHGLYLDYLIAYFLSKGVVCISGKHAFS